MAPFFTIGVTTYRRREFLRECLTSITQQTVEDFEVLVGNDCPDDPVSADTTGISDSRVRYINHERNMGEMANMNYLLHHSAGRYFTWLADDDMLSPGHLAAGRDAVTRFGEPECVFPGCVKGSDPGALADGAEPEDVSQLGGSEFLLHYLAHRFALQGCYGLFRSDYITHIGGMRQLGTGFSPYSDCLLAFRAATLENVVFIDRPLVFWRTHGESISIGAIDRQSIASAQLELLPLCLEILGHPRLTSVSRRGLAGILRWCLLDYLAVSWKSGRLRPLATVGHVAALARYARLLFAGVPVSTAGTV